MTNNDKHTLFDESSYAGIADTVKGAKDIDDAIRRLSNELFTLQNVLLKMYEAHGTSTEVLTEEIEKLSFIEPQVMYYDNEKEKKWSAKNLIPEVDKWEFDGTFEKLSSFYHALADSTLQKPFENYCIRRAQEYGSEFLLENLNTLFKKSKGASPLLPSPKTQNEGVPYKTPAPRPAYDKLIAKLQNCYPKAYDIPQSYFINVEDEFLAFNNNSNDYFWLYVYLEVFMHPYNKLNMTQLSIEFQGYSNWLSNKKNKNKTMYSSLV